MPQELTLQQQAAKKGDPVATWYDTGAMGATILYWTVIKAGPKTCTIEWESDIRNRVAQDRTDVWHRREQ